MEMKTNSKADKTRRNNKFIYHAVKFNEKTTNKNSVKLLGQEYDKQIEPKNRMEEYLKILREYNNENANLITNADKASLLLKGTDNYDTFWHEYDRLEKALIKGDNAIIKPHRDIVAVINTNTHTIPPLPQTLLIFTLKDVVIIKLVPITNFIQNKTSVTYNYFFETIKKILNKVQLDKSEKELSNLLSQIKSCIDTGILSKLISNINDLNVEKGTTISWNIHDILTLTKSTKMTDLGEKIALLDN